MCCRSFFVLLYFFCWPLCCLFFFDIQILITPLVSSNSSYSTIEIRENVFCFDIILLQCGPHCVDMRDYLREMTFNYFERKFSNYIFLSVGVHHSKRIRYQSISNTLSYIWISTPLKTDMGHCKC